MITAQMDLTKNNNKESLKKEETLPRSFNGKFLNSLIAGKIRVKHDTVRTSCVLCFGYLASKLSREGTKFGEGVLSELACRLYFGTIPQKLNGIYQRKWAGQRCLNLAPFYSSVVFVVSDDQNSPKMSAVLIFRSHLFSA